MMVATWEWIRDLLSHQTTGREGMSSTGTVKGVQLAIAEDAESVDHLVSPEEAVRVAYGAAVGILRTGSRSRLPVTGMKRDSASGKCLSVVCPAVPASVP